MIVLPGLLAQMKCDLGKTLPEFEIITGTAKSYSLGEFVKKIT